MNIVRFEEYCFVGDKAVDSVEYFKAVISHGYDGDKVALAWDAAHKFGNKMTTENIASFYDGIVVGENALVASEYIDKERDSAYNSCEKFGRSKRMKELMLAIYDKTKEMYNVQIVLF